MTNATLAKISAPAISRILSNAGVKKSRPGTGYSTGFECIGLEVLVQVHYTPRTFETQAEELERIARILNRREKYTAEVVGMIVEVRLAEEKTEDEIKEDRMEELAEESPFAVTKREVNKVLEGPCYPYNGWAAGYVITRESAPNDRLVRVTYRDHAHTTYAFVEGGREAYFKSAVKMYADRLRTAGFSVKIEGDYDYVLVGQPGEFLSEDDPDTVKAALNELREAVETSDVSFMTRKAGPTSIFVYYLVPFKDKVRRCEVFWSEGIYRMHPRFGGPHVERAEGVTQMVTLLRNELAD